ncbi:MAG: tetratricopeptide repeat protein [Hyphomicrobiaceae bacterium]
MLSAAVPASAGAAAPEFRSPADALSQGIGAYQGGYYEMAIPALEAAAAANLFDAQYYLARIYSDNQGAQTDHAKAYLLYQKIANDYADVDPDDDRRAPFVAKALTALAGYVRRGLPEISLSPDPERAAEYLHHAALFFNDEDAQFELAKLQLRGEGVPSDVARGKHWLATLSQKGHAGAQAFLADLYWRGMFMPRDQVRALALISVAVKNAPLGERVWIEDTYQNIYCGAPEGVRKQVGGMVAEWDSRYGRRLSSEERFGFFLDGRATRTCSNGEVVPLDQQGGATSTPAGSAVMPPATNGGPSSLPADGMIQGEPSLLGTPERRVSSEPLRGSPIR